MSRQRSSLALGSKQWSCQTLEEAAQHAANQVKLEFTEEDELDEAAMKSKLMARSLVSSTY